MDDCYLCLFFCVSAGQNGESLGCDEQEIIAISNIIFDLKKLKSIGVFHQYVKPRVADVKHIFISEDCKLKTELNENYFKNAKYIEHVIESFDKHLRTNKMFTDDEDSPKFKIICDGNLHLRQLLLPECVKKGIEIPSYFYSYYDLRKEFNKFYQNQLQYKEKSLNIVEMLQFSMLPHSNEIDFCLRQCCNMENIVMKLLSDGYEFKEPEIIMQYLVQGIWFLAEDDEIEENTCVKARGLPWQCTDQDIAKFFHGLNIAKGGIALCLSSQGRRNGEALIRFVSEEHRDLAVFRHKHHIGQRYIEVYRATGRDFLNVAGGSNSEAQSFLLRNGQVIVRMRGLPFDASAKDVTEFFEIGENSVHIVDGEQGVLFVYYPDGRSTGDAFVMFKSEEEAAKALLKHKEIMGSRYIELFRSTTAEVQQVFKRSQDPKHYQNALKDIPFSPLPLLPPEMISGGNKRDCVRLRNLPIESGVEQILEFLGIHSQHIIHQGVHMIFNSQGQPSGEAFIQMDGEHSAYNTANHKHNKYIFFAGKKYYIEVLQCSGEEMNLVLMGVVPSNLLNISGPKTSPVVTRNTSLMNSSPAVSSAFNNFSQIIPSNQAFLPTSTSANNAQPQPTLYTHIPITATNPGTPLPQMTSASSVSAANTSAAQFYPAQILYWYPTPPVSPSSTIYIHPSTTLMHATPSPCIIVLRNVPQNATIVDLMHFLSGFPEITPENIQIQKTPDGRSTGDVLVTFFNRMEAERAIIEKNHQNIGDRTIDIYLAV